ncbi:kinase-like domain-containing protein [Lentinula boryana]|uniref:Kinase-like domain-containing protein n=1 Tax=Lentinula boryana TaxID=40481 RepID=A0ABQ8QAD1_9AGAR|nr:kinase-like domain-containing protein [Lentinula boryana]
MPLSQVQSHAQLEAIVSLNSDLQRALDEYDAYKRARILNPNLQREPLLWLGAAAAQRMMVTLQAELDSNAGSESHRRSCFSLICHLVKRIRALPLSLLIIKDVERVGRNPVAGGGFADVWRGIMNGEDVCLKVLRLVTEQDERTRATVRKRFCREALVWRQLKHPHILPLLGVNMELFLPSFCLISPWMENKDIITFLKQNPNHNLFRALIDVAAGMCYLHSRDPPIVHGDIRGANILVTNDGRCCLADFGLALVTSDVTQAWSITSSETSKGALRWMAPEYLELDGSAPTSIYPSRDVYAFGCTIIEILTQNLPFHHCKTEYTVFCALMRGERPDRPPKKEWFTDNIWALTTHCWAQNALDRPSSREVSVVLCRELERKQQCEREDTHRKVQNLVKQIQRKKGLGKDSNGPTHGNRRDVKKKLLGGLTRWRFHSKQRETLENQWRNRTAMHTEGTAQQDGNQQTACSELTIKRKRLGIGARKAMLLLNQSRSKCTNYIGCRTSLL